MKVTKPMFPDRMHAQYRTLTLTIEIPWKNPNPPHIFDCTDQQLEERMERLVARNATKTLPLSETGQQGFLHEEFFNNIENVRIKVKARECGENGKPLNLYQRLRYLLTGRYRY